MPAGIGGRLVELRELFRTPLPSISAEVRQTGPLILGLAGWFAALGTYKIAGFGWGIAALRTYKISGFRWEIAAVWILSTLFDGTIG